MIGAVDISRGIRMTDVIEAALVVLCQMCDVYMEADIAHNMYPIPAVYQRIFNQLTNFKLTGRQRFLSF